MNDPIDERVRSTFQAQLDATQTRVNNGTLETNQLAQSRDDRRGPRTQLIAAAALLIVVGFSGWKLAGRDSDQVVEAAPTTSVDSSGPADAASPMGDLPVRTWPEIDSEAILSASGFQRCPVAGMAPEGDTTVERGQELAATAIEAGIGAADGLGGDGTLPMLRLNVLDEATLSTLATFADPEELCVKGADPNDYVVPGPQQLSGPGWRWAGAGSTIDIGESKIIDNQEGYDKLWTLLGEGPETEQIAVDFDTEVILTYSHGAGVNFGECGVRFDGYGRDPDGQVVLDFFQPGGNVGCERALRPAIYAVALERRFVGEGLFDAAVRDLPRADPRPITLSVGEPATARTSTTDGTSPESEPAATPELVNARDLDCSSPDGCALDQLLGLTDAEVRRWAIESGFETVVELAEGEVRIDDIDPLRIRFTLDETGRVVSAHAG